MINKYNKHIILIISIILLNIGFLYSQEQTYPLTKFSNLGFSFGVNNFSKANVTSDRTETVAIYKKESTKNLMASVDYNYFINKQWSINSAIQLHFFGNKHFAKFSNNELSQTTFSDGNDIILNIPISVGYSHIIYDRIYLQSNIGMGLAFYRYKGINMIGSGDMSQNSVSGNGYDIPSIIVKNSNNNDPIYTNAFFKLGIGFDMDKFYLQPEIVVSQSFKNYQKGTYQFSKLKNEQDFGGTFEQSGSYIGFHIGVRFKKKEK